MKSTKLLFWIAIVIVGAILYFEFTKKRDETYTQISMTGLTPKPEDFTFWGWLSNEWNGYYDNYLSKGKLGRFGF